MNGDWPDPRSDLVKRHAGFELSVLLRRAKPPDTPGRVMAVLAETAHYCAAVLAMQLGPEKLESALARVAGGRSGFEPPPLPKWLVEQARGDLVVEACRCWPAGAPTVRAICWALMVGAIDLAAQEVGPSGARIVAALALDRLRRSVTPEIAG